MAKPKFIHTVYLSQEDEEKLKIIQSKLSLKFSKLFRLLLSIILEEIKNKELTKL